MSNSIDRRRNNYDKLDLLAAMIEPMSAIVTDREAIRAWREQRKAEAVGMMIRNHKPEIIELLAALDGVAVSEYALNPDEVLLKLLARACELSELVKTLFPTRAQSAEEAFSGHAMGNTGAGAI